jgi:hypothetical protein
MRIGLNTTLYRIRFAADLPGIASVVGDMNGPRRTLSVADPEAFLSRSHS